MPKISVIVPVYNVAPYLERCLNSLIGQTLKDIEIICVDDKSTDNSLEILREYEKKDKRVKVFALEKNGGVAIARNTGIDAATGEFIGFVDPDDYVDLDFYEKLYTCAIKTNSTIVKGNGCRIDVNTGRKYIPNDNFQIMHNIGYWHALFVTAIYKRNFLIKHNLRFPSDLCISEDALFLTRVTLQKPSIYCIDDVFYYYMFGRPDHLDSDKLSHKKAVSNSAAHKLLWDAVRNANLSSADMDIWLENHIFMRMRYMLKKKYESKDDHKIAFETLVAIAKESGAYHLIDMMFGSGLANAIKTNNFPLFLARLYADIKWWFLFGILPIIKVRRLNNKPRTYVSLFGIIPLLEIKRGKRFYLFNVIPLLKIKG
ncbi:glycosyltransferase [bacterium]|nr:glycosyltransferase [bacterium]